MQAAESRRRIDATTVMQPVPMLTSRNLSLGRLREVPWSGAYTDIVQVSEHRRCTAAAETTTTLPSPALTYPVCSFCTRIVSVERLFRALFRALSDRALWELGAAALGCRWPLGSISKTSARWVAFVNLAKDISDFGSGQAVVLEHFSCID